MPFGAWLEHALLIGWTPSEFWAASLWELECAMAAQIPRETAAMSEADQRKFLETAPRHA